MTNQQETYRLSEAIKEKGYRQTLASLGIHDGITTSTDLNSPLLIVPREVKEQPAGRKFVVLNVGLKLRERIEIHRRGGQVIDP